MFAERMNRLGTETAFEVLAKARALEAQGRDIVHLEIGEPDFDTPDNIRKAAEKAIWAGYTHYGPSAGLMEARKAVCEHYARDRGVEYSPDEIVLTPGGKPIRGHLPESGVSDLRVGDQLLRREGHPAPAQGGARLPV